MGPECGYLPFVNVLRISYGLLWFPIFFSTMLLHDLSWRWEPSALLGFSEVEGAYCLYFRHCNLCWFTHRTEFFGCVAYYVFKRKFKKIEKGNCWFFSLMHLWYLLSGWAYSFQSVVTLSKSEFCVSVLHWQAALDVQNLNPLQHPRCVDLSSSGDILYF